MVRLPIGVKMADHNVYTFLEILDLANSFSLSFCLPFFLSLSFCLSFLLLLLLLFFFIYRLVVKKRIPYLDEGIKKRTDLIAASTRASSKLYNRIFGSGVVPARLQNTRPT